MNKQNIVMMVMLGTITSALASEYITKEAIESNQQKYEQYLSRLSSKIGWTPELFLFAGAKKIGYTQEEINAIPIAYPFLCEGKKYQEFIKSSLLTDTTVTLINSIYKEFQHGCAVYHYNVSNTIYTDAQLAIKKRTLLHQVIHEYSIKELGLEKDTTTQTLASKVKEKSVDMQKLYQLQGCSFYLKFHLNL